MLREVIPIPDITNKEKEEIRTLAKCFSEILSKVSFKKGSTIYYLTFKIIYKRSARWKYCLICGKIDLPKEFLNEKHSCPSIIFHKVQVLVSTSWIQLKHFFLENKYRFVLAEVGIKKKDEC